MNKPFTVLFALTIGVTCVHAQTSSGNMMVGGGLTFSSVSYQGGSDNDGNRVSFSPGFGYFINDNLAIGSTLVLNSERSGTGANKTITTSFELGPFARYYIFTSNEKFGFFGQAQVTFGTGKTDPPAGDVTRRNSFGIALSPGAAYFFNEHWAIEFAIRGFAFRSVNPDTENDDDKYTIVDLGLNSFEPTLAFRYHF